MEAKAAAASKTANKPSKTAGKDAQIQQAALPPMPPLPLPAAGATMPPPR
jgi:hypothetical protein